MWSADGLGARVAVQNLERCFELYKGKHALVHARPRLRLAACSFAVLLFTQLSIALFVWSGQI